MDNIKPEDVKRLIESEQFEDGDFSYEFESSEEQQAILTLQTLLDQAGEALGTCMVFAGCELEYDAKRVEDALTAIQPYRGLGKHNSGDEQAQENRNKGEGLRPMPSRVESSVIKQVSSAATDYIKSSGGEQREVDLDKAIDDYYTIRQRLEDAHKDWRFGEICDAAMGKWLTNFGFKLFVGDALRFPEKVLTAAGLQINTKEGV